MARTRSSKSTSGKKTTEPKGKLNHPQPSKAAETAPAESVEDVIPIGYGERVPSADPSARPAPDEPTPDETRNPSSVMVEEGNLHRRIAERAFLLYLEGGCRHGSDLQHWFEAEREMRRQQA